MSNWKWCLEENGKVVKGWYQDKTNGKWYHLSEDNGTLNLGWFQDKDKRWYYLDDKNGDLKIGWIQLKFIWYYLEPNSTGYMGECYIDCTTTINGKEYTFDKDGHMLGNSSDSLVSDQCIDFVKSWEGFFANKYIDCVGIETQGYGLTGSEIANLPDTITEETPSNLLKELINSNYAQVIQG